MKKAVKIILIILAVIVVLIAAGAVYLHGFSVTHKGQNYEEKYRNDKSGDCVYFTEDDFGEYENVTYKVKDHKGLFRSVGSMFVVTYSDEQYDAQLQAVNALDYLEAGDQQDGEESYDVIPDIIPAEQVEDDGWLVRILNQGEENNYPKEIAMIGTNDEEKTIVYMYFTDGDLDYISETAGEDALKDFIEEYFNFKF